VNRRTASHLVGAAVGLVGLGYVVRLLKTQGEAASELILSADPVALGASLALGLAGMTLIGLAWNRLLAILDRPMGTADAMRAYFVGQLGKYVPGGVWAIVGRG
jgi:hypothetical protein